MDTTIVQEAIKAAGGQNGLARALGVSQGLVWKWVVGRGSVTPECAPGIERVLARPGVCEQLCPDVDWIRDEAGQVTHYQVRVQAHVQPEQKVA
jgi:DNA-binding transcriptional regulator YdaS (Cro superfamily)